MGLPNARPAAPRRHHGLRVILLLPAALAAWLLAPPPARAQVTVDLHALDGLPSRPAPEPAPKPVPVVPHTAIRHPPAPRSVAPTPAPATPPAGVAANRTPPAVPASIVPSAAPASPALPAREPPSARVVPPPVSSAPLAPPPAPVLAGVPAVPSASSAVPPRAPIGAPAPASLPAAAGPVAPSHPLTVLFRPKASTLAPADAAAITRLARTTPETDATSFTVLAYAAGSPQNPSAPRRLSLARALAVRAALRAGGAPAGRIYLRAMGAAPGAAHGAGPADRAEILVSGNPTPAAGTAR